MQQAPIDNDALTNQSSRATAFAVMATLLIVATAMNVGLFVFARSPGSPVRPHADNRLSTLVVTEQRSTRLRHGFEAYVHDLVRGGVLTVPGEHVVNRSTLETFSQVDVVVAAYDPERTLGQVGALGAEVVVVGVGRTTPRGDDLPYRFLMRDATLAPSVTYFRVGDEVYIIDDRLGIP